MPSTSGGSTGGGGASNVGTSSGLFGKRAREDGEQSPQTEQDQGPVKKSKTVVSLYCYLFQIVSSYGKTSKNLEKVYHHEYI